MDKKYNSWTHGKLTEEEVFEQLKKDILKSDKEINLVIGTDSQTYHRTKVVTVIALEWVGHGGKFFYSIEQVKRIEHIRVKIYNETLRSLELAKRLVLFLFDNDLEQEVGIHLDMGKNKYGKTHTMINEISGWVTAEGFIPYHKPNSYVASTIADRISK